MIVTIKASVDMEVSEDDLKKLRRALPGSLLQTMQAQDNVQTQVVQPKS